MTSLPNEYRESEQDPYASYSQYFYFIPILMLLNPRIDTH